MATMIIISIAAVVTAIVGCALIWGFDLARSREIESDAKRPSPVNTPQDDRVD